MDNKNASLKFSLSKKLNAYDLYDLQSSTSVKQTKSISSISSESNIESKSKFELFSNQETSLRKGSGDQKLNASISNDIAFSNKLSTFNSTPSIPAPNKLYTGSFSSSPSLSLSKTNISLYSGDEKSRPIQSNAFLSSSEFDSSSLFPSSSTPSSIPSSPPLPPQSLSVEDLAFLENLSFSSSSFSSSSSSSSTTMNSISINSNPHQLKSFEKDEESNIFPVSFGNNEGTNLKQTSSNSIPSSLPLDFNSFPSLPESSPSLLPSSFNNEKSNFFSDNWISSFSYNKERKNEKVGFDDTLSNPPPISSFSSSSSLSETSSSSSLALALASSTSSSLSSSAAAASFNQLSSSSSSSTTSLSLKQSSSSLPPSPILTPTFSSSPSPSPSPSSFSIDSSSSPIPLSLSPIPSPSPSPPPTISSSSSSFLSSLINPNDINIDVLNKNIYESPIRNPIDSSIPISIQLLPPSFSPNRRKRSSIHSLTYAHSFIFLSSNDCIFSWKIDSFMTKSSEKDGNRMNAKEMKNEYEIRRNEHRMDESRMKKEYKNDKHGISFCQLNLTFGPNLSYSPCQCMIVDSMRLLMWTGHENGMVCSWKLPEADMKQWMDKPLMKWQASQHAISALTLTSYCEIWYGTSGGELRALPRQQINDAMQMSFKIHGNADVASFLSRATIDVRDLSQSSANSSLSLFIHSKIIFLHSDWTNGRVITAGMNTIAIWDARTRELITFINTSSSSSSSSSSSTLSSFTSSTSLSSSTSSPASVQYRNSQTDNFKPTKSVHLTGLKKLDKLLSESDTSAFTSSSSSKKSWKFLKKSTTAVIGAVEAVSGVVGDAVLRAANSAASMATEDSKYLTAMLTSADGKIWCGFSNGNIIRYDGKSFVQLECNPVSSHVSAIHSSGKMIWIGCMDGKIHVINAENAQKLASWQAHETCIVQLSSCDCHVISASEDEEVKAWSLTSPGPIDDFLTSSLTQRADEFHVIKSVRFLAATWNVGEAQADMASLHKWLFSNSKIADVIVIGLQEMVMGASSIALAAAKETVGMGLQEKGSTSAQSWLNEISKTISKSFFQQIASRQLAGVFIGVWVKFDLVPHINNVEAGAISCGFGRALGNKGAVGIRFSLFGRHISIINSHFAAHMEAVDKRNQDWSHVYHKLTFGRSSAVGSAATNVAKAAGDFLSNNNPFTKGKYTTHVLMNSEKTFSSNKEYYMEEEKDYFNFNDSSEKAELSETDLLIWIGDLNYRINGLDYYEVKSLIQKNAFHQLFKYDQLSKEMKNVKCFRCMKEATITFPPTYKFDKSASHAMAYDSSEKRRVPAWCDRVLYRDSEREGFPCPSLYSPVKVDVVKYDACMDVRGSDHKPVSCLMHAKFATVDEHAKRKIIYHIMDSDPEAQKHIISKDIMPDVSVSTRSINLKWNSEFRLSNHGDQDSVVFSVGCEATVGNVGFDYKRELHFTDKETEEEDGIRFVGFPPWIRVSPASGLLEPQQSVIIEVVRGKDGFYSAMAKLNNSQRNEMDNSLILLIRFRLPLTSLSYYRRIHVSYQN